MLPEVNVSLQWEAFKKHIQHEISKMEEDMSEEVSKSPTTSPTFVKETPDRTDTMDFPAAIRAITDGKVITKLEWDNPETIAQIKNERLMIRIDGLYHPWTVTYGDMTGEDWTIV